MPITLEIAGLTALVVIGGLIIFRTFFSPGASKNTSAQTGSESKPRAYRAVSRSCGESACSAARELRDIKYLAGQTPYLPLQDCDQGQCECRYAHYDDRRDPGSERRTAQEAAAEDAEQAERRNSSGRRRTDWTSH